MTRQCPYPKVQHYGRNITYDCWGCFLERPIRNEALSTTDDGWAEPIDMMVITFAVLMPLHVMKEPSFGEKIIVTTFQGSQEGSKSRLECGVTEQWFSVNHCFLTFQTSSHFRLT